MWHLARSSIARIKPGVVICYLVVAIWGGLFPSVYSRHVSGFAFLVLALVLGGVQALMPRTLLLPYRLGTFAASYFVAIALIQVGFTLINIVLTVLAGLPEPIVAVVADGALITAVVFAIAVFFGLNDIWRVGRLGSFIWSPWSLATLAGWIPISVYLLSPEAQAWVWSATGSGNVLSLLLWIACAALLAWLGVLDAKRPRDYLRL